MLDCDVDCVWCVGDTSRVVGRLVANEAAELQTRRRRQNGGRRRQKAGVVLVDRTLDVLPALPQGADAVLHAVAARSAADGELPRLSGASCDALRALLADPQALKGRAIATLAPLAARDARVQELLRRGISSTERLFALCKSVAVSEAGGLHAAEPAADDGDRRVLALVCHLAGLDVSALQDRAAAADGADDAAASTLEGAMRGLLKAMKEALRSVSGGGGGASAAAENAALDASVDAIAGLLVAFATHGDGGGGGGGGCDGEAGEGGGGGGGGGWAEVSEEESILLEEYTRVLQRLLLAAVAAAAADAGELRRRLGGSLAGVLLRGADGEAAAVEEAASRVLRGARRVCGARRAAGVLSEDLLGGGGGGGGFLAGLSAHAAVDTGLLLRDAVKIQVEDEAAAAATTSGGASEARGWLGTLGYVCVPTPPPPCLHSFCTFSLTLPCFLSMFPSLPPLPPPPCELPSTPLLAEQPCLAKHQRSSTRRLCFVWLVASLLLKLMRCRSRLQPPPCARQQAVSRQRPASPSAARRALTRLTCLTRCSAALSEPYFFSHLKVSFPLAAHPFATRTKRQPQMGSR